MVAAPTIIAANVTIIRVMTASRKRKDSFMPDDRQITTCGCSVITDSVPIRALDFLQVSRADEHVDSWSLAWHGSCI
jgi:hypothetical protein